MRHFAYNGDHGAVTLWGIQFPRGVAVPVENAHAIAKLEGNNHFAEVLDVEAVVVPESESAPVVETVTYTDGAEATGVAPLPALSPEQELQALRDEAKALGVKHHHKAGADTIRAAIAKSRA